MGPGPSGDPGAGRKEQAEASRPCGAPSFHLIQTAFCKKKPRRPSPCRPWPPGHRISRRKFRSVKRPSQRRHVAANMNRSLTVPTRDKTSWRTCSGKADMSPAARARVRAASSSSLCSNRVLRHASNRSRSRYATVRRKKQLCVGFIYPGPSKSSDHGGGHLKIYRDRFDLNQSRIGWSTYRLPPAVSQIFSRN